jgi:hypothetical protein
MINKKPTHNLAALKNILILPAVAILIALFSFRLDPGVQLTGDQEPLFSKTSNSKIMDFIYQNISYPQEAKNAGDTGSVFVVVKMNKGGIVQECKAFSDKKGIKVPIMDEVVVTSYKPASGQSSVGNKPTTTDHTLLKSECSRIANKLGSVNIPEWKDKNMEFAMAFRFVIK